DASLAILQQYGQWASAGPINIMVADIENFKIAHRTPFQKLPSYSDDTRYELSRLGKKGNLPFGLDIWHKGKKVMLLEWSSDDYVELPTFKRGEWEQELFQVAKLTM
ncbi:hypothetical protein, partial [Brucella sp. BO2]